MKDLTWAKSWPSPSHVAGTRAPQAPGTRRRHTA